MPEVASMPIVAAAPDGQIHVIKVGTSTLLTNDEVGGQKANLSNISRLVELIAALRQRGDHVVLVSSGAVGMGCLKLGLKERPKEPGAKQALAAAGQSRLMRLYEDLFQVVGVQVAQLLISREDFSDKARFLSVRNTCYMLMKLGVVPIINENDSVSVQHVANFGDNDTMAAMSAALLKANWLFLATDVDFLYTANPKDDPNAKPIHVVEDVATLRIAGLESSTSQWGTGGMATKLIAARIAVCAGVNCGLINGMEPERIGRMIRGDKDAGTHFTALARSTTSLTEFDHNHWIIALPTAGTLVLDKKGYKAVLKRRNISVDMVVKATGDFAPDDSVLLMHEGTEIARALARKTSAEVCAAVKEVQNPTNGLRDFTQELQAAGIYLAAYNGWRKGGHKGARGEMNSERIRALEKGPNSNGSDAGSNIVAWGADVALLCATTIKEVEATDENTKKRGRDNSPVSPRTAKRMPRPA